MLKSYKIIKNYFIIWIVSNIVLSAIVFTFVVPGSGLPPLAFFQSLFLMVSIINLLCTLAMNSAGYLMRRQSMIIGITVIFVVNICAAIVGNTICYYLSEYLFIEHFYKSKTDHLIEIFVLIVPIFILSVSFTYLKIKKSELENQLNNINNKIKSNALNKSISIKLNEGYCHINFDNLIYLSSHGKKTTFHTIEKDYTANYLLKDFEKKLPDDRFIRIHRQYIINIKYLQEIRYYEGGRYMAYLNNEDETMLPVGINITPQLKEKIGL